jgi:hydroxypyruvate reductase
LLVSPREAARAIWRAALAAGDVAPLLRARLRLDADTLAAGDVRFELGGQRRVIVLGAGKAGASMASARRGILGDHVSEGFVVVGRPSLAQRAHRAGRGRPSVPDARGVAASRGAAGAGEAAGPDDLVIVLISGGGQALTPARRRR